MKEWSEMDRLVRHHRVRSVFVSRDRRNIRLVVGYRTATEPLAYVDVCCRMGGLEAAALIARETICKRRQKGAAA